MPNKIKSYEDACKTLNLDTILPDFPTLPEKEKKAMRAHYKLVIIAQALNKGWRPHWGYWYVTRSFPWFGFRVGRFVFRRVSCASTCSCLGSRLCYKDRETARYAGKTFADLYNDYFQLE